KTLSIRRIVIDPSNSNIVYVAAMGSPFSSHPERGLYKTINGGKTWKLLLHTNDSSGCADLVINPKNPAELYASIYQFKRTPWNFKSGGEGSGLYKTVDGGKKWQRLDTSVGLPSGNLGKIGLAMSNKNPKTVYALVEATHSGLFKTNDGGKHWQLVNQSHEIVRRRPFYFQDIVCDPNDDNILWSLTEELQKSVDGGKKFKISPTFHLDNHVLWISPADPSFLMLGNDGGFGISRNNGLEWNKAYQLALGQIYHVNTDNHSPYHVMGGSQDEGTWFGEAYNSAPFSLYNSQWKQVNGGDGFDVIPDKSSIGWTINLTQVGDLRRTSTLYHIEKVMIDGSRIRETTSLRNNWNTPIAKDPFNEQYYYYGTQFLHYGRITDRVLSKISPDLTTNDSLKYFAPNNGGLTPENTGAENYSTLLSIEPSRIRKGLIWIGTDDGNVQMTMDGGKKWTNLRDRLPGLPVGCRIPQIRASVHSADEAFVVANNYMLGDTAAYIYRTRDMGRNWERVVNSEKVKGHVLCVLQDPVQANLLFVGTSKGLFVSIDDGQNFEHWNTNFPCVQVTDMVIQERENDLVLATFGRSFWIFDNITPLRQLAKDPSFKISKLFVFELPVMDTFSIWRFPKATIRTSPLSPKPVTVENRPKGFEISFYINPNKISSDSVTFYLTGTDDLLFKRGVTKFVKSGFNRLYLTLPIPKFPEIKYNLRIKTADAEEEIPIRMDASLFLN
ncbi:MAG: hypothetical protein GXC73_15820, partial [Chitinophagaceae bacterium]|nr:hypothetical protein [Chitinophagaceae bacterium]